MRFSGVTLDPVAPVTPDKTDRPVWNIISVGAGAYDWLIKFGPLVTFCVLIDSLGNVIFPQIGATNFSFASIFLSLDDALFLTGLLILKRFNLA